MSNLPIDEIIDDLLQALNFSDQILLQAPPGAGKSTRLPLRLLEQDLFDGKIILLEPRRLAAKNIARFLAQQCQEKIGETIGFRMRGETCVSDKTRIEVITEGVLSHIIQQDPLLTGIDLIIFDEFHERSLQSDLALALTLDVQSALRPSLKLILMSATLDNQSISTLLPDAKVFTSQGRSFAVKVHYQPFAHKRNHYAKYELDKAVIKAIHFLIEQGPDSILVFLPQIADIKRILTALAATLDDDILLYPLHGQLPICHQQNAMTPAPFAKRKIVLATNIAETSLTIEGISFVVDSGFERVARFNPKTGLTKLETAQISCSSAIQRAGRAGRLSEGICVRLYSEESFKQMRPTAEPQILNSDLSQLALNIIQWGCQTSDLKWLDMPQAGHWQQALSLLNRLDILDNSHQLTLMGRGVAAQGIDVRLGTMLHFARSFSQSSFSLACWFCAWIELSLKSKEIDLQERLIEAIGNNALCRQRAKQLAKRYDCQLQEQIDWSHLAILAALAWPDRIAKNRGHGGRFLLANGHGALLDINSSLASSDYLVAIDLMHLSQGDSQIFCACSLDIYLLEQCRPNLFFERDWVDWNEQKGLLEAQRQKCLGELVISWVWITKIDQSMKIQALLKAIKRQKLACLELSDKAQSLLIRAQYATQLGLSLSIPAMDEQTLLDDLENWLAPFMHGCTRLTCLKKIDMYRALEAKIGWDIVTKLNQLLPETYQVGSGARYKIRYQLGAKPILSLRIQEMYGQAESPSIADGQVILLLELLSPALRPIQITQDLSGFWQGSYKEVQKEMKGRYPKHVWPDFPATYTQKT